MEEEKIEQIEAISEEEKAKNNKKKSATKYALNIALILIITVVAIFLTVRGNFKEIIHNLKNMNLGWLLVACAFGLAVILVRGLIYFAFARLYTRNYKYSSALAVDMVGIFYNNVTPGATGGQPMQAVTLSKQGLNISSAVSIMAMYLIIYQFVSALYGLVAFFCKYKFLAGLGPVPIAIGEFTIKIPIWLLTILGFSINAIVIVAIILMSSSKKLARFISGPVVNLLAKIRIIKNPEKTRDKIKVTIENFRIEFKRLFSNIPFFILIFTFFIIMWTLRYSLPFFLGKSLGNQSSSASFFDSVFLCTYHHMITNLIPIPGSAGVSEYFFNILFVKSHDVSATNSFFYVFAETQEEIDAASNALSRTALLMWRSITFIFPLIVAGFVTAFYKGRPNKEEQEMLSGETFITLQAETLIARKEDLETMIETTKLSRQEVLKALSPYKNKRKSSKKGNDDDDFDDVNIG